MAVSLAALRKLVLGLPGVQEGTSYGTAAWRVRKKLLARLREDSETLVVACSWDQRAELCEMEPDVFFFTEHYANHEYVLVRLPAVSRAALASVLESGWRRHASKRMLAEHDGPEERSG